MYAIIKGFINLKRKESTVRSLSGAFFIVIPAIFGLLQMLYPDGPFYSLGFAVFSVAIYAINVTRQREHYHEVSAAQKGVVKYVIALTHDLGAKVIAESVENEEQKNIYRDLGCDYIQG